MYTPNFVVIGQGVSEKFEVSDNGVLSEHRVWYGIVVLSRNKVAPYHQSRTGSGSPSEYSLLMQIKVLHPSEIRNAVLQKIRKGPLCGPQLDLEKMRCAKFNQTNTKTSTEPITPAYLRRSSKISTFNISTKKVVPSPALTLLPSHSI